MGKEGFIGLQSIKNQARAPFNKEAKGIQIRLGTLTSLTSQARGAGHTPSEAFNISMIALGRNTVPSEKTTPIQEPRVLNTNGWREIARKRMLTRDEFKNLTHEEQREYYFNNMNA